MTTDHSITERHRISLTPIRIEGFLACYGEQHRFCRDSAKRRRADVRHAAARLYVTTDSAGKPTVSASRTNPDHSPSLLGFMEVYEAGSNLTPLETSRRFAKLRTAVTLFIERSASD